ncbi:MAG: YtxH domain-containing protein [Actinobacteria bacterium]|nr:MAG: YtxH domain-containing protein [Actinomycetota bacterium]
MTENQWRNFYFGLIGFFTGALAGTVSALLMAPQTGEKTREMLSKKGIEGTKSAKNAALRLMKRSA